MKKIKKLEERKDMYMADDSSFIEFLNKRAIKTENKVNEIIDLLNGELSKPRIQVESQKQPEGVGDFPTSQTGYFPTGTTTSLTEPEKQEEWRERISTIEDGNGNFFYIDNKFAYKEDMVRFISQLLSERTFNKEELRVLKKLVWEADENVIATIWDDEIQDGIEEKLSKLLKEEG